MTAFLLPCVPNQIALIQIDVLPGFIIQDGHLSRANGLSFFWQKKFHLTNISK
jgi:hypothetical protein